MYSYVLEGNEHGLFEAALVDPIISHQIFFTDLQQSHLLETDAEREVSIKNKIDSNNIEVRILFDILRY